MSLMNTPAGYGLVSRLFHWVMAFAIVIVFALGIRMVRLDYQSPYYTSAPDLHRSLGVLLLIGLIARFCWRMVNPRPAVPELTVFEKRSSYAVHLAFYLLILILTVSGYFISSANGEAVDVLVLDQKTAAKLFVFKGGVRSAECGARNPQNTEVLF